jgi:uncharacterized membrane protein
MASTFGADSPPQWLPAVGGTALVLLGAAQMRRERPALGVLLAAGGAGLFWQTTRGRDPRTRLSGSRGTVVEEAVAINRTPSELYGFWRNFERLPTLMPELTAVRALDDRRSHWIARGPAGKTTEWDAEIINDIKDELIAWQTTGSADVVSAGSVHFDRGAAGRGTTVRVRLQYSPPGGKFGAAVAWAFGDAPDQVIREGLRRFKQLMETGEIPTTAGQPRGG